MPQAKVFGSCADTYRAGRLCRAGRKRYTVAGLKLTRKEVRIVDAVRSMGEASRSEVERQSGLAWSSVSEGVGALLDEGLLVEDGGPGAGRVGRRQSKIRLKGDAA